MQYIFNILHIFLILGCIFNFYAIYYVNNEKTFIFAVQKRNRQ